MTAYLRNMMPFAAEVRSSWSTRDAITRAMAHDHIVQFYESEDFLSGLAGGFLAAGLRAGRPIVAVATGRHREAFSTRLASAGVDVESACGTGQLTFVDAQEAVANVMVGGAPRWDRFRAEIGGALERAASGTFGPSVRVYAEMVDVLWQEENARAAVVVEEFWNELGRTHTFSLLCVYAMAHLPGDLEESDLSRVCGAHTYVVPAESWAEAGDADARLREVIRLQQRAHALERELERRRELEAALRAALDDRRRAMRLSEMFVGMLGHDLRNPLNAISTAAGLIARRAVSDGVSQPARRIVRSAGRMARMIDQMLDFTRIRLGHGLPLLARSVDLGDVCRLAAEELEGEAAPRVRLEPRGDVVGSWDPDRLSQLVSNLVGNALVHGRPDSPVTVRIDGTASDVVVLEVENAGAIPPDVLPGVFEPFSTERSREPSSGLGLGLHISRQVVLAHGGTIDVASSEEEGTRFTVRLPRSR